jgi:soluble cytochrome b562
MFWFRSRPLMVALNAVVSLLSTACADTQVYQCNEIIGIANETVTQARDLTAGGQTTDPQAMLQAADAMEQASAEMEAVEVEDEQLQDFQEGFVTMYQKTAQATRSFVKAYEESDREAAESAFTDLQQATSAEDELVQGINEYCRQGSGE